LPRPQPSRELSYVPIDQEWAPRRARERRRAHRIVAEELEGARVEGGVLSIHDHRPAAAMVGRLPIAAALTADPLHTGRLGERAWWRPAPRRRPRPPIQPLDPAGIRYVDLETTGLAGGTGTLPFLIGIAGFAPDASLWIEQLLLRTPADEPRALARFAALLEGASGICTFNGKTFDVPLLRTRYVLARRRPADLELRHLDLLHPARRVYRRHVPNCRLTTLEAAVLEHPRRHDTPGWLAPIIYGEYLRSGDASELGGIVRHNRDDLVAMVGLLAALTRALAESE
jgi:uncharacterized protein YprB with RNaseH-like and TPR domain